MSMSDRPRRWSRWRHVPCRSMIGHVFPSGRKTWPCTCWMRLCLKSSERRLEQGCKKRSQRRKPPKADFGLFERWQPPSQIKTWPKSRASNRSIGSGTSAARNARPIGSDACRPPARISHHSKTKATSAASRARGVVAAVLRGLFPGKFKKSWSPDHLVALKKIEQAIRVGDLFALAMPRGSGKTTMIVAAILWAILCGHRSYIALIVANQETRRQVIERDKDRARDKRQAARAVARGMPSGAIA